MSVREPQQRSGAAGALDALPGLARIAATAWWHTAEWTAQKSVGLSWRLLDAATSPRKAAALADEVRHAAGTVLRDIADLLDLEDRLPTGAAAGAAEAATVAADVVKRVADAVPMTVRSSESGHDGEHANGHGSGNGNGQPRSLQEQGELLLRLSRDVNYEFDAHPAYERILSELAPDEARILQLMLVEGPQPSVDVRTGGPLGMVRSQLIAPGLTMIGARSGCRYVERVPAYLNNLFRLGLIWFSRETLHDPMRYQVLEAQPDVLEAIHSVTYAKVVRRSVHLTPFGEDFCRTCLSPGEEVLATLPQHSAPPEHSATPQPPTAAS